MDPSLAVSDHVSYFDVEDFDVADGNVDILTPLGADSDEVINFVYVDGSGFGFHKVTSGQGLHVLDEAPAGTQSERGGGGGGGGGGAGVRSVGGPVWRRSSPVFDLRVLTS